MEKKRRRWVRWTKAKRAAFLDHLAATGNVRASAAQAGMTPPSVYHLRRKDAEFVEEWRKAVVLGFEMLETELLGHVLAGGGETIVRADGGEIAFSEAVKLLGLFRAKQQGDRKRSGPPLQRARPEDTDAAILKKLAAMDRLRAQAAAAAQDA